MDRKKKLTIFLKKGFYHGLKSGFYSSAVFIVILIILIGLRSGSFQGVLITLQMIPLVVLFAIPLGFFPAISIGMFLGLIIAFVFYIFQSRIENNKWSVVVTVLISLLVALPAISAWWLLIIYRNNFEGLGNFPTILVIIFMPFCIGAGIYIHAKLEAFIVEFGDLFNE